MRDNITDRSDGSTTRRDVLKAIGATAAAAGVSQTASAEVGHHTLAAEDERLGPVTPRDTVYQILTDRFSDGDPDNNDFSDFDSSLYDGSGSDLKLYQGGDWQGIVDRIPYLKDMGVTAVWLSAPYDNRESKIVDYQDDGTVDVWTSYHGYHARNYFRTHRFFGGMQDFYAMRDALHDNGIKLVIDFVSNHTSRWKNPTKNNEPEEGQLYEPDTDSDGNYVFDENGDAVGENLLADPHNDVDGWFHGIGDRGGDTSKFGYRHKDLGWLADFSHENGAVVDHLERATKFWKSKGIDGIRHDATLHLNPAFAKNLKTAIDSAQGGPITHFGEFFISRPDPKYEEYRTFPDRTGINNLDFEFNRAATNVFGHFSETMTAFGEMLLKTHGDYTHEHQTITAVDNHDMTRFRYIQPDDKPYHAAIAALMTCRGTPKIYYGTEQYMNPGSSGPNAGRLFMQTDAAFDTSTTAYQLISDLAQLRDDNLALAYGLTNILHSTDDVIVYERQFYDHVVVTAIHRQPDQSESVPSVGTNLPDGTYDDYLSGDLYGQGISVDGGALDSFTLGGGEVSVWESRPDLGSAPKVGTIVSTMGQPGDTVYIYGAGLDGDVSVTFDGTPANVVSNSTTRVTATVPDGPTGLVDVAVEKNGQTSNATTYDVLSDEPVQVIFHVEAETVPGETIHVVGDLPELGNWDPLAGSESFMNPDYPEWFLPVSVPKNTSFEFKFVKIDEDDNVTWESGSNRSYTSPTDSTETDDTPLYYWQS
ncbi:alpha-amylase family glycosyl hydrolase [Halosimplex amylolyticum]|uniref:alpha-amylase family glycosyl hydrolase n=1 Tax=Halosimplex amylolyticum TaxID=3396616 RepID=UPI003F54C001